MSKEQVIEWLGRWGKDWVHWHDAYWVFVERHEIIEAERQGHIERDVTIYRLTDKAIQLLENNP